MEQEEEGPPKVTLAVIGAIALLVPILVASFLVLGLQPPLQTSTTSGSTGGPSAVTVVMPAGVGQNQSMNYQPASITVVVGVNNTIKWVQDDPIPHTVTSTSVPSGAKAFDSKNLNKGDGFSVTLTVPGVYDYDCTYHPGWMKGTITVKQAGGSTSGVTTSGGGATGVTITLPNGVGSNPSLNFGPPTVTVVVGVNNTITWSDQDPIPHTVTSTSVPSGAKGFDSGIMKQGDSFTQTFTVPGTYKYFCTLHPNWMIGTIIVKAPS